MCILRYTLKKSAEILHTVLEITHTWNGKFPIAYMIFSTLVYDFHHTSAGFFPYQRMKTRECMGNFQVQTKNLYNVWDI